MAKTVRKMLLDAINAIDMHSIKAAEVKGVTAYRHGNAPEVRLTAIAFQRVFRATGLSIKKVKRSDTETLHHFEFLHHGVEYRCCTAREEVEEFRALTQEQLRLPEPSVRISATSQLLLGGPR